MTDEDNVREPPDQSDPIEKFQEGAQKLRTDGGEILTANSPASSSYAGPTPEGPATTEDQTGGESSETFPTNQGPANSEPSQNGIHDRADLFSGTIDPDEILDFYLATNPWGVQPGTVNSYTTRLRYFRRFCDQRSINDLRDFGGHHADEFHNFLREQPQLGSRKTIKDCLASLRKFLRYCERRGVFEPGFHEFIILPELSDTEGVDDTWLPRDEAKEIVAHLAKYEPFSKQHIVWVLLSETGIRQSTLYAFDLEDYNSEERYVEAVNREETGTRLKNGADGEREISISSEACQAIDGYIQAKRNDVTDQYGRQPLITTRNGRIQKSTIRQYVYAWSRPCAIGTECPVEKDPETCQAAQTNNDAFGCPESISPHPIRKGYITHLRANGVPTADVISDRCDASPATIEKWYDMCMESERREARRTYVEGL